MELKKLKRTVLEDRDLTFIESVPYVYHCHHYNLFHDQTIDDALGEELGTEFRTTAAQGASHLLLSKIAQAHGVTGSAEKAAMAMSILPWMGHGRLLLEEGGAKGEDLHYGHCWREKYGATIKRLYPCDGFAAGFGAAALEVASGQPPGTLSADETECIGMRSPHCTFEVQEKANEAGDFTCLDQDGYAKNLGPVVTGEDEDRISGIAAGLQEFMRGVHGDDRGLVQAFGVYVTMHSPTYYNQTAYRTTHWLEKNAAAAVPAVEALLRESGHVCVFHTFGNILLSPEWEGLVARPTGDVEELISYCCAIARGLGFGRWAVGELVPGERLVLRTGGNYEAPCYLARHGTSEKARCYFFQGAALAMMVLAQRVDWKSGPTLTQEFYRNLFRAGSLGWKVEETHCRARGDDFCEAVVTAA